jgi:predicted dehydrogenase
MTLRIALAGIRHYHANFWVKAIAASPAASVAGVWDADAAAADAFAREHGVARAATLEGLLAVCDGVAICSATSEHRGLVEAACRAGRPILCEKPLGTSVEDGRAIARAVAAAGVPFQQSFPKRLDPASVEVARIVRSRDLGRIHLVRVRHGHSHGLEPDFHRAWFTDPALSGGGTLIDEGVHAADFLRMVFGNPETVIATHSAGLGLPVEDTALAAFRYGDGMIAEVATSWCFAAADASVEVYGTEGTLLLSGVDLASRPTRQTGFLRLFTRRDGWRDLDLVPSFRTGVFHEHVAWAFIAALSGEGPMPAGIAEGLAASAMIEAAYRAAASGERQTIDYPAVPA